MKNIILIITFILLSGVLIFSYSDTEQNPQDSTEIELTDTIEQKYLDNIEPITDVKEVGTIDRSSDTLLNRNKGYLPDASMARRTILGTYWYTLVSIDENISLDLYIKHVTYSAKIPEEGEKTVSANVSQIVMSDKSKGTNIVIWAQMGMPDEASAYTSTYVPIYDIIVNKNLERIRIIYQNSLSVSVDDVNLNEHINEKICYTK